MNRKEETNGGKDEGVVLMTNIKDSVSQGLGNTIFLISDEERHDSAARLHV